MFVQYIIICKRSLINKWSKTTVLIYIAYNSTQFFYHKSNDNPAINIAFCSYSVHFNIVSSTFVTFLSEN